MARQINKLSDRKITSLKKRGFYADGGGLYLQVSTTGSKSWVFRSRTNGRLRDMGLGSVITFSLAEAREKARACRQLKDRGIDPIEARRAERLAEKLKAARSMTFDECRDAFIADKGNWKNAKHRQQWVNTLTTYVTPVFGSLPVQSITTDLVVKALRPIWKSKNETASRVRGRIEQILSWATTSGHRTGDNPARWQGHLSNILAAKSEIRQVEHHPSLPYVRLPSFMADLRGREGIGPRALEFTILTASRSGESVKAEWSEFDLDGKVWTVPAVRMKGKREHRVTLSDAAVAILRDMEKTRRNKFVFPSDRSNKHMSDMTLTMLLRRMSADAEKGGAGRYVDPKENNRDVVPHGFRSSFKDWARERTGFANEVSEAALAHVNGDKVEAAYARGDMFDKRRKLMDAWAAYCASPAADGQVIPMRRGTDQ